MVPKNILRIGCHFLLNFFLFFECLIKLIIPKVTEEILPNRNIKEKRKNKIGAAELSIKSVKSKTPETAAKTGENMLVKNP